MKSKSYSPGTYVIEGAYIERESDKAVLVCAPDFDEPTWVPKSALHDDSEVWKPDQDPGDLVVHEWLAEKRGWV
jgi:hypothetical protein